MPELKPLYGASARWVVGGSIILFIVALCFPAFYLEGENDREYPSLAVFLLGWLGVEVALAGDFTYVPWLANPLLAISLICILSSNIRAALISSALAIALGLSCFLIKSVLVNEAGGTSAVVGLAAGYYLWLGALMLPFGYSIAVFHRVLLREIKEMKSKGTRY